VCVCLCVCVCASVCVCLCVCMFIAGIGFYLQSVPLLITTLFFMGTQSTFFGPLKYGILPQLLREEELVKGNGLIEMGTFLAILLGTIIGGILIALKPWGSHVVGVGLISIAVFGFISSFGIPKAPSHDPTLKINWNFLSQTHLLYKIIRKNHTIFLSILGISWFWFFGATFLIVLPNYCKIVLGGNERLVTLFLAVFSIGIGVGSILCARLSGKKVELGLVPFGTFGMTLFTLDLFWVSLFYPVRPDPNSLVGVLGFIQYFSSWRIMMDLFLISVFSGFFIVPLYALIQQRSERSKIARVIAGNNIINAFFMVLSSLMVMGLIYLNIPTPWFFFILAGLNLAVAIYIYRLNPEFLLRFMVWLLVHSIYQLKPIGVEENLPEKGPAVLVCNHVTFVDSLIIASASKRFIRFIMHYQFLKLPFLRYFFEKSRIIPIASFKEDPSILEKAYEEISKALENGELVCIFPEGHITTDGEMIEFRTGVEKILERNPVPVIPTALQGLWRSYFGRKEGRAMKGIPKSIYFKIGLVMGKAIAPEKATAPYLHQVVSELRGDWK